MFQRTGKIMRRWGFRKVRNMKQLRRNPITRWSSMAAGLITVAVQMIPVSLGADVRPRVILNWDKGLPAGWSALTTAEQRNRITTEAQRHRESTDVRELSPREMRQERGRGSYRNQYFGGSLPWQRSLRDVNLCTGNLFKSFTDIQVAPAKGAGLALQRTYNSDDPRIGPFGVGWTHAYDIENQDEVTGTVTDDSLNYSDRKDFFSARHKYHRDADGLYSPPPYLYDELSSDYLNSLVNGPIGVQDDIDIGMDGTTKHYIAAVTGTGVVNPERLCDYIQDRYGNQTNLAYNQVSWPDGTTHLLLSTVTDPSGRQLSFTWTNEGTQSQPAWRITQVVGPQYVVNYSYYTDPSHPESYQNLQSVTVDPAGVNRTTTFTYTSYSDQGGTEYGLLASITDPNNETVSYQYSLPAQCTNTLWVSQVTEPAGLQGTHVWSISGLYNPSFNELTGTWTDNGPAGQVLSGEDGASPNLQHVSYFYGSGQTGATNYDDWGNVTFQQWPVVASGGRVTLQKSEHFTYGPHGNVLTHTCDNFSGTETTTWYNASQYFQKASFQDFDGNTTNFDVGDNQGNDPWGVVASGSGNKGSVLAVRDARYGTTGVQYVYNYNSYGQKTQETNLNGVATQYTYGDAYGNLTQVVQDPGVAPHLHRTTSMTYDVAGHVTQSTDPSNLTSNFTYNNVGQPVTAQFPTNGSVSGETVSYTYGANGRMSTVADNRGTTTLAYENGSDRVSNVTDPVTGTVGYTYTKAGARASMSLPGGGSWQYTYSGWLFPKDDPNAMTLNLTQLADDQGRIVNYSMYDFGTLYSVKFNQVYSGTTLKTYCEADYTFDKDSSQAYTHGWLTEIKNTFWHWSNPYYPSWVSSVLTQNDYTYDNAGLRLTNQLSNVSGPVRTESYGYDALNRLTRVNYGDGETQSYTFDPMGNRTQKVDSSTGTENSTYNAANMLLTRGSNSYTNDSDGNTLTGGGRTSTWDSENRLVSCSYNGNSSSYVYSADGLRRRKTVNGTATDVVLDSSMFVRDLQGGVSTATYLVGARGPEYRRDDSLGNIRWYCFDGLGSVLGEVDQNGVLQATRSYDVYGTVRTSAGTSTSKHKFCGSLGHPSDDETGLIYMRARYADPATGCFISQDPKKNGNNWFAYAGANPVNYVDNDGCIFQLVVLLAIIAAILLLIGAILYLVDRLGHFKGQTEAALVSAEDICLIAGAIVAGGAILISGFTLAVICFVLICCLIAAGIGAWLLCGDLPEAFGGKAGPPIDETDQQDSDARAWGDRCRFLAQPRPVPPTWVPGNHIMC